jgi:hypothetical protein
MAGNCAVSRAYVSAETPNYGAAMSTIATVRSSTAWENIFDSWSSPPSDTEKTKCDNAVRAIRKAVDASDTLSQHDITVVGQGSYRNGTNARLQSDVDVSIRLNESCFFVLPDGVTAGDVGISTPATYGYSQFKNDVEEALRDYFGSHAVTRGKKAFDVHENTYRIDADAVATFKYHLYDKLNDGRLVSRTGTAFLTDGSDVRVVNWPEQNYEKGVSKNTATEKRFKRIVRILKRLRYEMADKKNIAAAVHTPSFLVECLVYNVPNEGFNRGSYHADVRYVLAHLFNSTMNDDSCNEWVEVNEVKYLFRPAQPWTRQRAHDFLSAAWDYIGFE